MRARRRQAGPRPPGSARPSTIGHRQDDQERPSRAAPGASSSDWLGVERPPARTMTPTSPSRTSAATSDLGHGQQPDRVADPRPDDVEQQRADREADEEDREDHREHVRRVAGPRREQPRPQHLVAERGQTRHEGDAPARGVVRLGARAGRGRRRPSTARRRAGSTRSRRRRDRRRRRPPAREPARAPTTPGDRRARRADRAASPSGRGARSGRARRRASRGSPRSCSPRTAARTTRLRCASAREVAGQGRQRRAHEDRRRRERQERQPEPDERRGACGDALERRVDPTVDLVDEPERERRHERRRPRG